MTDQFNNSQGPSGQKNANNENLAPLPALPNQANVFAGGEGIVFHKPAGEKKRTAWVNIVLFIGFLFIYSLIAGIGFSYIFSLIIDEPFDEVVLIGIWFGPLTAIFFALQRIMLGKNVETSFQYTSEEELTKQIGLACEKFNYSQTADENDAHVWSTKTTGWAGINFDPITVQMKNGTATIKGQKALLERVLTEMGLPIVKPQTTQSGNKNEAMTFPQPPVQPVTPPLDILNQSPGNQTRPEPIPSPLPLPTAAPLAFEKPEAFAQMQEKPKRSPKKALAMIFIVLGVVVILSAAIWLVNGINHPAAVTVETVAIEPTSTSKPLPTLTSTAAWVTQTNLIAEYDFSQDYGEWPVVDSIMTCGNERMQVVDGVLEWTILDNDRSCFWAEYPINGPTLSAFEVSVEAQRVYGANTDDFGLIFVSNEGYSYDFIISDASHTYSVWMYDPSGWQEIVPSSYSDAIINGGVNLLMATSDGERVTFSVNGYDLTTIDVNGISPVYIGVTADVYEPGSETQLRFDNYRISSVTTVAASGNTTGDTVQSTEAPKPGGETGQGQPIQPAQVSGRVDIPAQNRGWNTTVELYDPDGNLVGAYPTDADGNYSISITTSGTYRLVVWLYRDSEFLLDNCQNMVLNDANWDMDYDGTFDVNTGLNINYLYYYSPEFTLNGGESLEYTLEIPCP